MQGPWGFSYKIAFCYVAFFLLAAFSVVDEMKWNVLALNLMFI